VNAVVTTESLPMFVPYLGPSVLEAIGRTLEIGYLGLGPLTREFEVSVGQWLGLAEPRSLMATNSGTAALHLATLLSGARPGTEIICPAFTYVAAHQAVAQSGADVVFCDVNELDLCADPARVAELITHRTVAIMVCHYAGHVAEMQPIYDLAADHGLRVIEDAAHAFGSVHPDGTKVGARGDLVCFSFGQVKTITTLDGGAIVTGRADERGPLQEYRVLGVDKDLPSRYRSERFWEYDVVRQGYRYHLSSVPAAVGLAQLAMADNFIENRRRYCKRYDDSFRHLPGVSVLGFDWGMIGPFIYPLRVATNQRSQVITHLKGLGVPSGLHWGMGGHEFTFFRSSRRGPLPNTNRVTREIVTLPLWSFMPDDVVERIIDSFMSFSM